MATVLSDVEVAILQLKLTEPHLTNTEIGQRIGRDRSTVSRLINSDPLRREIDDALQDIIDAAKDALLSASVEAVKVLVDLMHNGDSDHTKRLAALNVLQVLQRRGESGDIGDEEWESVIGQSGAVKTERVRRQIEAGEDEDPDAN